MTACKFLPMLLSFNYFEGSLGMFFVGVKFMGAWFGKIEVKCQIPNLSWCLFSLIWAASS